MTVCEMPVQHVDVSGLRLAYHGAGEGRPIVFVHGNFASKRWFTEQLKDPPTGWRVIAIDLPNFGDSEPMPEPIGIEAYARYLRGFLEALELKRPVLVGHSLGGAVVQELAAQGHELAGLVLLSSPSPKAFVTPEEHYLVLASLVGNRELMMQALAPTVAVNRPDYFPALVDDALRMKSAAYTENGRALARYGVEDRAAKVGCPVLVVRGEHDYLVSEALARETAEIYGARLELLGGLGHSPQLEDPKRFGAILRDFLGGLP